MKIDLSADVYEDAGIVNLINRICGEALPKYFENKNYGNNKVEIFMVINCVPYNFKLRKRYDNKEKVLYWDIILNYDVIKKAETKEKKHILANSIISSFDILDSYKKLHLDKYSLKSDAKLFFESIGWLKNSE